MPKIKSETMAPALSRLKRGLAPEKGNYTKSIIDLSGRGRAKEHTYFDYVVHSGVPREYKGRENEFFREFCRDDTKNLHRVDRGHVDPAQRAVEHGNFKAFKFAYNPDKEYAYYPHHPFSLASKNPKKLQNKFQRFILAQKNRDQRTLTNLLLQSFRNDSPEGAKIFKTFLEQSSRGAREDIYSEDFFDYTFMEALIDAFDCGCKGAAEVLIVALNHIPEKMKKDIYTKQNCEDQTLIEALSAALDNGCEGAAEVLKVALNQIPEEIKKEIFSKKTDADNTLFEDLLTSLSKDDLGANELLIQILNTSSDEIKKDIYTASNKSGNTAIEKLLTIFFSNQPNPSMASKVFKVLDLALDQIPEEMKKDVYCKKDSSSFTLIQKLILNFSDNSPMSIKILQSVLTKVRNQNIQLLPEEIARLKVSSNAFFRPFENLYALTKEL